MAGLNKNRKPVAGLTTKNCQLISGRGKCFNEQTTEQGQRQQDDQDCSDCCSPFMSCNTCNGFTVSVTSFSVQSFLFYSDLKVSLYDENFASEFFSSIWQPPKIV